jgi:hypothetical protein
MSKDSARHAYMDIIQGWEGYGSNLFDVEQTSNKQWPKDLTLGISLQGVGIFPRGEYVHAHELCPAAQSEPVRMSIHAKHLLRLDGSALHSTSTRPSSVSVPLLPTSTRLWLTTSARFCLRPTWYVHSLCFVNLLTRDCSHANPDNLSCTIGLVGAGNCQADEGVHQRNCHSPPMNPLRPTLAG